MSRKAFGIAGKQRRGWPKPLKHIVAGLGLFAAIATSRPASAYRTNGELAEFAGTPRVRWNESTVAFHVVDLPMPQVSTTATSQALQSALSTWNMPSCHPPALVQLGPSLNLAAPGDGSNSVQWVAADWGQDPNAPAYADVQFEQSTAGEWRIVETDIYLNAAHGVYQQSPGSKYLPAILAHEVGHALGLLHSCEMESGAEEPTCDLTVPPLDLMYPVYALDRPATPSADDIAGLSFLYEHQPDPVLIPKDTTTNCTTNVECLLGFQCVRGRCSAGDKGLGEPCALAGECDSAACAGFCSVACSLDSDCDPGEFCQRDGQGIGACVGPRAGFGEPCTGSSDCLSALCMAGAAGGPTCTSECSNSRDCPLKWACDRAAPGDKHVCAPRVPEQEAGCNCSVGTTHQWPSSWVLMSTGVVVAVTRRPRRRKH